MRAVAFLVVALAGLAMSACGDDDGGSSGAVNGGLGSARYEAIEALFVAGQKLEQTEDAEARAVRPYVRACEGLDRSDPLLARGRRVCALEAKFFRQFVRYARCSEAELDACVNGNDIAATLGRLVPTVGELERAMRAADEAVRSARLDADCEKSLLVTDAEYRDIDEGRRGYALLARAMRSGSEKQSAEAERLLQEDSEPSAMRSLARFREGCD